MVPQGRPVALLCITPRAGHPGARADKMRCTCACYTMGGSSPRILRGATGAMGGGSARAEALSWRAGRARCAPSAILRGRCDARWRSRAPRRRREAPRPSYPNHAGVCDGLRPNSVAAWVCDVRLTGASSDRAERRHTLNGFCYSRGHISCQLAGRGHCFLLEGGPPGGRRASGAALERAGGCAFVLRGAA